MSLKNSNITSKLLNPFKGDRAIWVIFTILAIISLISVYSSIGYMAASTGRAPLMVFIRHLASVLATFVVVILMSNFDYRKYSTASWFGYIITVVLLVIVLFVGQENEAGSGMSRWLKLPVIHQFQPSELAKVVMVVYLARLLARERDHLDDGRTVFIKILIPIFLVLFLIIADNMSTTLIIFFVCFAMLRLSPMKVSYWRKTILGIIGLGVIFIIIGSTTNIRMFARFGTWESRVEKWVNGDEKEYDETKVTQEDMMRMAVATGRYVGVGVGSTVQARLMTQANNDMIYCIIVEESGIAGALIVLILYIYLYIRCLKIAWSCRGDFGRMSVVGLGTLIFLQAAIHMGVSVGAFPVTGQNLPFISSGGSAYLCMGLALGVIQSVAYDVNKNTKNNEVPQQPENNLGI